MIKAVISGKIIKNLELGHTPEGKEYLIIRLSSKKKLKDEDGKPMYDYVDIVAFGEVAKCHFNNLKKGSSITAICRFETNQYTDRTGEKRYGYSFYAEDIDYLYIPKPEEAPADIYTDKSDSYPFTDGVPV